MQSLLDRRPAIPCNLHKIVQAEYANIFQPHRVIVGCGGSDRKILFVDTIGDIPSCSREISLIREYQAGRNDLTAGLFEIYGCTSL
jgi:hypothetical protein